MKLHFFGAAQNVTGSCFMLEWNRKKILIDCGMFQGPREVKERNYKDFPFDPGSIDYLILSHAHIDHSGLIPKLVKKGYKGNIYCSTATKDLASIMLPDSGHIQEMEVERKNRKLSRAGEPLLTPIYTVQDGIDCLKQFVGVPMKKEIMLEEGLTFRLSEAGHILGSAIIELWAGDKKLVFTGDLGNKDQPIVKDPDYIDEADYLIIESTYGSRIHSERYDKEEKLKEIIKDTFARGGNLIIPAFAVARTQDLLYHLYHVKEDKEFSDIQIFVDSPLAIEATKVFCNRNEYFDEQTEELARFNKECPLIFDNITFTRTAEESKALNQIKSGAIIISASGMADAGRIKHHLKHNLWRPESTVLFVGYQAMGTLGRRIADGEKVVRIHGEEVAVQAKILFIDGFSAHADKEGLIDWLNHFKRFPQEVFIVHGEEESMEEFSKIIEDKYKTKTHIPKYLETFQLLPSTVKMVQEGKKVTADNVKELYGEIINLLDAKVNKGVKIGEYGRLMEKLYRVKDYIDKI